MLTDTATVLSPLAPRYLVQLCKHFAHKIPAEAAEGRGRAVFPWGICLLAAEGETLTLHCEAADAPSLDQVKQVVEVHMLRFARREGVGLTWASGRSAMPQATGETRADAGA